MSPHVLIRHAVASDGPAVRAFVTAILWAHSLSTNHLDLQRFGRPFNGALAELVAVRDGEVIGMATLYPRGPRTGWISKLFVDPEHRGIGAGRALLAAITDEARGWGLRRIGLSTLPILRDAVRLYESSGWKRARSRGRGDDRVYWLLLEPSQ